MDTTGLQDTILAGMGLVVLITWPVTQFFKRMLPERVPGEAVALVVGMGAAFGPWWAGVVTYENASPSEPRSWVLIGVYAMFAIAFTMKLHERAPTPVRKLGNGSRT